MNDSLQNIVKTADLLTCEVGDSCLAADSVTLCADSVWIGGQPLTTAPIEVMHSPLELQLTNPIIQCVMLGVVLAYLVIACRRFAEAVEMSSWLFYASSNAVCEGHTDRRFAMPWRWLGFFGQGLVATIIFFRLWGDKIAVPPTTTLLAAIILVAGVWILQWLILTFTGGAVMLQRFADAVTAVRRYTVEMIGVWITPFAIGCALSSGTMENFMWWIVVVMCCALTLTHLMKILNLFIAARFSIFYWFLYLCAVEIFPLSLAVAVTLRIL